MTCLNEETPRRLTIANLTIEELPDELMIYDPNRNKAFCLNQTAAFVWKHADGSRTVDEIADLMSKQMSKPVTREMIEFSLNILAKDGLLDAPAASMPIAPGLTRRSVLQKFGLGALALPAVTVLLVSPARAHASAATSTSPHPESNTPLTSTHHHHHGFWDWLENLF